MAGRSNVAEMPRPEEQPDAEQPEVIEGKVVAEHVLVLGEEEFVCADKFPNTLFVRYAENDVMFINKMLTRLVDPVDHERMWDAYEALETDDERLEALAAVIRTYGDRPTERPERSARGSQTGKRR